MRETAIERRDVDVGDDLRLHVTSAGAGTPVVLLHGFTGAGASWDPLREALAGRLQTVTVDLPGHGRSTAPHDPARYALARFARDLAQVLDALALGRVALLGYSLGGRAALHVALAHADRLSALVLESASPGIADPAERMLRRRSDEALARRIEEDGIAAFVNEWERLPLWADQRLAPETARALRAGRLANHPAGLAGSLRGAGVAAQDPLHDALRTIGVPTLVVAGERDARYAGIAREMAAALPDAQLRVVREAGHAVHLEQPAELAAVLLDFVRAR